MTTVILSLHPEWWLKILSGEKTLEIRKTAPHPVYFPLRVIVYLTKPVGLVAGEFTCRNVLKTREFGKLLKGSCLTPDELWRYGGGAGKLCGWDVFQPVEYRTPRKLAEFHVRSAPQSWCYGNAAA